MSCNRPGCAGTVEETGFCDTCGQRPLAPGASGAPEATGPRTAPVQDIPGQETTGQETTEHDATEHDATGQDTGGQDEHERDGRRSSAQQGSRSIFGLAPLEESDPASRVLRDPRPSAVGRRCGNCGTTIPASVTLGRQHSLTKGFCRECGNPFNFEPRLGPGELVSGQYEVVGPLGQGGFGWVYLARDRNVDNRWVVLKGLINMQDPHAAELVRNEREALTRLDHPNFVRIINFVTHRDPEADEPTEYIVMEYAGSRNLGQIQHQRHDRGSPLQVEDVIAYGREILAALEYLHGEGLLYCDLKPGNVMQRGDRVRLVDLGGVRRMDDWETTAIRTEPYAVSSEEVRTYGLTVWSDIYTLGNTLAMLFPLSMDWGAGHGGDAAERPRGLGHESFRRVVRRATEHEPHRRFASAAAMSEQLRGVQREVLALRDGKERPEASSLFAPTAALLDAGLGAIPPLERWTAPEIHGIRAVLTDGRPLMRSVAADLPVPLADPGDPAADFLTTVSADDPRRLVEKLARYQGDSVEVHLHACRSHLKLGDAERARDSLKEAQRLLDEATGVELDTSHWHQRETGKATQAVDTAVRYGWRMAWHRGLLALAGDDVERAEDEFDEVYGALPGEDAPKLTLGFCAEARGDLADAQDYYESVWLRDRSQVSAAFGLTRICLAAGDRAGAVRVLDQVPGVSRHYDSAGIAAVLVLSGRLPRGPQGGGLPGADDFREATRRLEGLWLDAGVPDGESRARLTATVRETALDWIGANAGEELPDGDDVLGSPVGEHGLRVLLERSFKELARQARTIDDHDALVDLANQTRPRSRW